MYDCTTNEFERPSADSICTDIDECAEKNPMDWAIRIMSERNRQFQV